MAALCLPTISMIAIIIAYIVVGMFGYNKYPGSLFLMVAFVLVVAVQIGCTMMSEIGGWAVMGLLVIGLIAVTHSFNWRPSSNGDSDDGDDDNNDNNCNRNRCNCPRNGDCPNRCGCRSRNCPCRRRPDCPGPNPNPPNCLLGK